MNTVISLIFNELKLVPDQAFKYNNKSVEAYLSYLDDYDYDYIDLDEIFFKLDKELDVFYANSKGGWSRIYDASVFKLILKEPSFIEPQILLVEEFKFLSKFDNFEYIAKQDGKLYMSFNDFPKSTLVIPIVTLKFDFKFMQPGKTYHIKDLFKHKAGEY